MAHYFQTLMAPSLQLDIKSRWFTLTEAKERIESRWQPAESVAAAARTAFEVNLVAKGRLFVSCFPEDKYSFSPNSNHLIRIANHESFSVKGQK